MAGHFACVQLYSTRIPLAGWGSTTLLAIAALLVSAVPEARMLTLIGLASGAAFGAALILVRSHSRQRETVAGGLLHLLS